MKLIRFGEAGKEKPGVVMNDTCYDVSAWFHDYDEQFFENEGLARLEQIIAANKLSVTEVKRFGCPVKRPSKIVCIGLNYSDHARETGAAIPPEPVIFMKSTTALIGPNDDVIIPRNSQKTDWEVELAVVIGKGHPTLRSPMQ
jgi:2,4-didehydro-3-deoxy-L-rhamnonate hydrolase